MSNPKPGPSDRRTTRRRGQALVEFALVIPIFLIVLSGILDFGFALYSRMTVINAAREGARAAVMVSDMSTIQGVAQSAANSAAASAGLTPSSVSANCVSKATSSTIACSTAQPGDSVSVTVNYTYHTFFPPLLGTTLNLSSTVQMVID